jgi:hypothetical protein
MTPLFNLYNLQQPPGRILKDDEFSTIRLNFYKKTGFPKSYTSPWEMWKKRKDIVLNKINSKNEIFNFTSNAYIFIEFFEPLIYEIDKSNFEAIVEYLFSLKNHYLLNIYLFDKSMAIIYAFTDDERTGILECKLIN